MSAILHGLGTMLFLISITVCGISDYRKRIIPNLAVSAILLAAALNILSVTSLFDVISRGVMAVSTLLLLLPWKRGLIGGGDVKLLFACAAHFNILGFTLTLIPAAVCSAVFSLVSKKKVGAVAFGAWYAPFAAVMAILMEVIF